MADVTNQSKITSATQATLMTDSTPTRYQVKLKESMYIKWEKPDLIQQVKCINLTLSLLMRARASVNFGNSKFM